MYFDFPKCRLFYNKFVLKSKVAYVLLHKHDTLFIQWAFAAYFWGVELYSHLFCRDRGLTRCAKVTFNLYFHVPFLLLGGKHQYMKWHLSNLKPSAHKSRITQNSL